MEKKGWGKITSKADTIRHYESASQYSVPVYGALAVSSGALRSWSIAFDSSGPRASQIAHKIFVPLLEEGLRKYLEALAEEING